MTEARPGNDLKVIRRPDCVSQCEVAVTSDAHVRIKLRFRQIAKAADTMGRFAITVVGLQKVLQKTHDMIPAQNSFLTRSASLPKPSTQLTMGSRDLDETTILQVSLHF
jgi:hypothetical protein